MASFTANDAVAGASVAPADAAASADAVASVTPVDAVAPADTIASIAPADAVTSVTPVDAIVPADTIASVAPADAVTSVTPVDAVAPADTIASIAPTDAVTSVTPADASESGFTAAESQPEDGCAAPFAQIMRSGASQEMSRTLLEICDTYLGGSRPRMLEATIHSANSKYTDGDLTPAQLAAFHCRMYEAMSNNHDNGNALVAWISSQERAQDHWKKLGYAIYEDYLKGIDPSGKVPIMVALHDQTTGRKKRAEATVQRCWAGFPELIELASRADCESRWRAVAALARATENAPDVAKFCLNKAFLQRIKRNTDGRSATKALLVPDIIEAKKMTESIDRATCPWDAETYAGVSQYKLKVYRGLLMSTEKHRGLFDPPRAVQVNVDLPGDTPTPPPALAPASSAALDQRDTPPSHQLTTENLAASVRHPRRGHRSVLARFTRITTPQACAILERRRARVV
jgi:hypothetical protein